MKNNTLVTIWYCSPVTVNDGGATDQYFTHPRSAQANIQTDRSELDIQTFGEYVNEIAKLRFMKLPEIKKGDAVYLRRPSVVGTFEKDGKILTDYGKGDFRVLQVLPAYIGVKTFKNPTTVIVRAETR